MTWNYRVVRRPGDEPGTWLYSFHEAYYTCSDDQEPDAITVEPVELEAESIEVFRKMVQQAMFLKPLDWETRKEIRE